MCAVGGVDISDFRGEVILDCARFAPFFVAFFIAICGRALQTGVLCVGVVCE